MSQIWYGLAKSLAYPSGERGNFIKWFLPAFATCRAWGGGSQRPVTANHFVLKSVKLHLQYRKAIPGCFVFYLYWFILIIDFSMHYRGFHIKKFNVSLQVDLVCNLLDIPVYKYVLYSLNFSCKKLVKEYFTFKSENKFVFINFINTHQSLYFKGAQAWPSWVWVFLHKADPYG